MLIMGENNKLTQGPWWRADYQLLAETGGVMPIQGVNNKMHMLKQELAQCNMRDMQYSESSEISNETKNVRMPLNIQM